MRDTSYMAQKRNKQFTFFHCKMEDEIKKYIAEEKIKSGLTWESFLKNLVDEYKLYGPETSIGEEEV